MKEYDTTATQNRGHTAIDKLSVDFSVPLPLACLMVGKTETETAENIQLFKDYIEWLIKETKKRK